MSDITMRQLLEAGVHFGHQTRLWCPKMSPYIYGHRNKIHIINLEQTLVMFNEAMSYLSRVANKRGTIMFVGTKRQASGIIADQAQRAGCPYVYHRWLGGMLTNYRTVAKSINRLNELDELVSSEDGKDLAKKEIMRIERERFRLNRNLAGIREMQRVPDALFVIDVKYENIAVLEAQKLGIPVVAVVDTNCDPDGIDYVIPGNDDAISAIRLFCTAAADAVLEGKASSASGSQAGNVVDVDGAGADVAEVSFANVTGAQAAVAPLPKESKEQEQVADPELTTSEPEAPASDSDAEASEPEAQLETEPAGEVAEARQDEPETAEQ